MLAAKKRPLRQLNTNLSLACSCSGVCINVLTNYYFILSFLLFLSHLRKQNIQLVLLGSFFAGDLTLRRGSSLLYEKTTLHFSLTFPFKS